MTLRFNYDYITEYYSTIQFDINIKGSGSVDFDLYDFTLMYSEIYDSFDSEEIETYLYEYFENDIGLRNIIFDDLDVNTIIEYIKDYYENRNQESN